MLMTKREKNEKKLKNDKSKVELKNFYIEITCNFRNLFFIIL